MRGHRTGRLLLIGVAVALGGVLAAALTRAEVSGRGPIRIGMAGSLFRDMPEAMVMACMKPFQALMESQTGLRGHLVPGGDAYALGAKLSADKVQLGVFHGFEFAWAQKKFPDLRPLMIAVNQQRHLYALLVVARNSPARRFADLKGKKVAIPCMTRAHCRLYLDTCCQEAGKTAEEFFGKLAEPLNVEDALDDVIDGAADAALVDGVALDCFRSRKPGRYARLRVLQKSGVFPAAVVAYHAGAVEAATLRRFQTGMMNAGKSAYGRQLLTLWKMTGFERVPADYARTLDEVNKTYPCPLRLKVSKTD